MMAGIVNRVYCKLHLRHPSMTGNNRSKGHPPNWFLDTCGQEIFYHELNLLFTRVTNFDGDDGGEDIII